MPTDAASHDWDDIERRIEQHQRRVRLCGPLAVARLLKLLGHQVSSDDIARPHHWGEPQGIPLDDVLHACREFEPQAQLKQFDVKSLADLPTPCILIVNDNRHCVVLESCHTRAATAELWDPSDGKRKSVPLDSLASLWRGLTLVPRPIGLWQLWLWYASRSSAILITVVVAMTVVFRRRHKFIQRSETGDEQATSSRLGA